MPEPIEITELSADEKERRRKAEEEKRKEEQAKKDRQDALECAATAVRAKKREQEVLRRRAELKKQKEKEEEEKRKQEEKKKEEMARREEENRLYEEGLIRDYERSKTGAKQSDETEKSQAEREKEEEQREEEEAQELGAADRLRHAREMMAKARQAEKEYQEEVERKKQEKKRKEEEEKRRKEEEEKKRKEEEEKKRKEEEEKKRKEEEEKKRKEEEEKKRKEEEARRKKEEEARKKKEEEARKKKEEEARKKKEEEARKKTIEAEQKKKDDEKKRKEDEAKKNRMEQEEGKDTEMDAEAYENDDENMEHSGHDEEEEKRKKEEREERLRKLKKRLQPMNDKDTSNGTVNTSGVSAGDSTTLSDDEETTTLETNDMLMLYDPEMAGMIRERAAEVIEYGNGYESNCVKYEGRNKEEINKMWREGPDKAEQVFIQNEGFDRRPREVTLQDIDRADDAMKRALKWHKKQVTNYADIETLMDRMSGQSGAEGDEEYERVSVIYKVLTEERPSLNHDPSQPTQNWRSIMNYLSNSGSRDEAYKEFNDMRTHALAKSDLEVKRRIAEQNDLILRMNAGNLRSEEETKETLESVLPFRHYKKFATIFSPKSPMNADDRKKLIKRWKDIMIKKIADSDDVYTPPGWVAMSATFDKELCFKMGGNKHKQCERGRQHEPGEVCWRTEWLLENFTVRRKIRSKIKAEKVTIREKKII